MAAANEMENNPQGDSKDNDYQWDTTFGDFKIKVNDSQGVKHEMPASLAAQSLHIAAFIRPEDDEESDEESDDESREVQVIDVPNVNTEMMRIIHALMHQFSIEPFQKLPRPITTDKLPVSSSFTDMLDPLSHDTLIDLLNAIVYLNIIHLQDLTAAYIAMKIKNDEAFRNFLAAHTSPQCGSKSNV